VLCAPSTLLIFKTSDFIWRSNLAFRKKEKNESLVKPEMQREESIVLGTL